MKWVELMAPVAITLGPMSVLIRVLIALEITAETTERGQRDRPIWGGRGVPRKGVNSGIAGNTVDARGSRITPDPTRGRQMTNSELRRRRSAPLTTPTASASKPLKISRQA
jgi:hypothetical protein